MAALDLADLRQALSRFVPNRFGPRASAVNVRSMDGGHAGLTFGFDVHSAEGTELASLIIRLAPVGVKRRGNTDVYRQAPLLKALFDGGLPVPRVPFSSPGEEEFGTPYIMMEKLDGQTFFVWDPDPSEIWKQRLIKEDYLGYNIVYAAGQPAHVNVNEILIRPTDQTF